MRNRGASHTKTQCYRFQVRRLLQGKLEPSHLLVDLLRLGNVLAIRVIVAYKLQNVE